MRSLVWLSNKRPALTRGSLMAAMGLAALVAAGTQSLAQSVFSGVRIDMSGLPAGAVETRQDLQACLARTLPQAFAGRITPGARAPVLTVRPTSVWLTNVDAFTFSGGFRNESGSSNSVDSLEGEATFGTQRIPLIVSATPNRGPVGNAEHAARVRTDALCSNFAYWLARKI